MTRRAFVGGALGAGALFAAALRPLHGYWVARTTRTRAQGDAATATVTIPTQYQALYDELQGGLDALAAAVPTTADVQASQLWPQLNSASDQNDQPFASYALDSIKNEIRQHAGWGATGVTFHVSCPGLDPHFYAGGATDPALVAAKNVWQQAVTYAQALGLKVLIECGASGSEQAAWASWLSGLSWTDYIASRARHAIAVAALGPDWISILTEPDTEQTTTGQPVATISNAVALVTAVLNNVRTYVPLAHVSAGCGTWMNPYTGTGSWVSALLGTAVDAIDCHIYPCFTPSGATETMMQRIYDLIAAVAGTKSITISECNLDKQAATEANAAFSLIEARDPFAFWYPLDAQFFTTLLSLQRKTPTIVSVSMAYPQEAQTALDISYLDQPASTVSAALNTAYTTARQGGATSDLGRSIAALFSAPTTAPPPLASLVVSAQTYAAVTLTWAWATPQMRQMSINLYRNGARIFQGASRGDWQFSYRDSGLVHGSTYTYTAEAVDPWGTVSTQVSLAVTL